MDKDTYVMLGDIKNNTIFAKGKVISEITKNGRELWSIDGIYYFWHQDSTAYRVMVMPLQALGEMMDFRVKDDYTYKSIDSDDNADIYIDLNDDNKQNVCAEIMHAISNFPNCKVNATFGGRVGIDFDDCKTKDKFLELLDYLPSNLKKYWLSVWIGNCNVGVDLKGAGVDWYLNAVHFTGYFEKLKANGYFDHTEEELLYYNNIGRKSFQWELWAMCNNLCKYCYLGQTNRGTDKVRQLKSLDDCYKAVCNLDKYEFNNISLIGGEFFQGQLDDPEVHDAFFKLIRKVCEYYRDKVIGSVWITCTLTIGDQHHLYEMLEMFKEYNCYPNNYGASGLWLCTSWDIQGRFHTPERLQNWEYHMDKLTKEYPWVKKNCTIILMQKFLEAYINDEWKPKEFMKRYDVCLFYKQIGLGEVGNDLDKLAKGDYIKAYRIGKELANKQFGFEFAPRRETMLKFLRKYAIQDPDSYDKLYNVKYRADELHRNYNDVMKDQKTTRNKNSVNETDVESENRMNTCGHIINYAPYIDSDKCCICDKEMVWDSIYGGI